MNRAGRILVAAAVAALVQPPHAAAQTPLTLAELLDRNATAMGGRERLDTLHTVVTLRNRTSLTSLKLPHFVLVEGFDSTGALNYAEGYNGREAWEQTRRDSARRVVMGRPEIALRRVVQWPGNVLPLYRLSELGHRLELEATETIDDVAYYRLRLTLSDGFQRWYYINAESFRIERARDSRELHANDGNVRHIETVFTDYRAVSGYWFPFTVLERDVGTGERLYARTMLAIFPNAEVADSLFDPERTSSFTRVEAFRRLHDAADPADDVVSCGATRLAPVVSLEGRWRVRSREPGYLAELRSCGIDSREVRTVSSQSEQRPEYRGQCAFALSSGKKGVAGKDSCYMIQDGRKYLFSNSVARFLWRVLPGRRDKAERNWTDQ